MAYDWLKGVADEYDIIVIGSGLGGLTGGGFGAAPRPEPAYALHQPPANPRVRRATERGTRFANRHVDDGLFDAAAPYRPAPEDDARGYLRRVELEVIDSEEVYRLYDPSRDRSTAGRR